MDQGAYENPQLVKELHRDLARKYQIHKAKIQEIWRYFDGDQRGLAFKADAAGGVILEDLNDRSLGNVYKLMLEYNLCDIAEPGSDYLLNLLQHRATKSLSEQYCEGLKDYFGDYPFILNSMRVNNLRHISDFKYDFTMFWNKAKYGESLRTTTRKNYETAMRNLAVAESDRRSPRKRPALSCPNFPLS
ncbi:hypothetical protein G7Y89_g11031 [Cudoniella acicularis]|uniref:Uncharacterized protein n=1 Tax=Cudoniella acicularis TaxID=354080 RepID=A0A8H4RDW7_9HELO|nr:hypothetical protein G7Y89_g11031 [Cudoniella acicularis]